MTALATACEVLAWAGGVPGRPPVGSLAGAQALASPNRDVREGLQQLIICTAARLGAGRPPLGDDGPVGLGTVLLAAAIGGRTDPEAATSIIRAVPPLRLGASIGAVDSRPGIRSPGWADAIARHGVAGRFANPDQNGTPRGAGDRYLVECLLEASPLTAILKRPPAQRMRAGGIDDLLTAALGMLTRPRGQEILIGFLSVPARDAGVLAWRAHLLTRLAREDRDAALRIYLAARLQHGQEWDELLSWAASAYDMAGASDGSPQGVLRFWVPLAAMDDEDPALLRSQPFLDGCRRAVDLGRRYLIATKSN